MHYRQVLTKLRDTQKIVVVAGLGISGIEAGVALHGLGLKVICTEGLSEEQYQKRGKYLDALSRLNSCGVDVRYSTTAADMDALINDVGLLVLSPGIPFDGEFVRKFKEAEIPITNELELAVDLYNCRSIFVTGTNGKSTTTTLIAEILLAAGHDALLCGNVGRPVIADLPADILDRPSGQQDRGSKVLVVEISSYQIESALQSIPDIGVFLNISENHLERHKTLKNYFNIKASLFKRQQQEQHFIYNRDDERVSSLASNIRAQRLSFGESPDSGGECSAVVTYAPEKGEDLIDIGSQRIDAHGAQIIGRHNRMNMAAAALAVSVLDVPWKVTKEVFRGFAGLSHRMERVPLAQPAVVFNDSKATTPLATEVAIAAVMEAYPASHLVLCVGGKLKRGGDLREEWSPVIKRLREQSSQVLRVLCFGGDGHDIYKIFTGEGIDAELKDGLSSLVAALTPDLQESSVVLFSPGCASFDEFTDFEQRGNVFKSLVTGSSS